MFQLGCLLPHFLTALEQWSIAWPLCALGEGIHTTTEVMSVAPGKSQE